MNYFRRGYFLGREFRRIRLIAVTTSVCIHSLAFLFLLFLQQQSVAEKELEEDFTFGSRGGGGGETSREYIIEFGPSSSRADSLSVNEPGIAGRINLIDIHVLSDVERAAPVVKEKVTKPRPAKKPVQIRAEDLPTRWVRRGSGPGSDGGSGGGSGGGIGASQGYSIDWGGSGSRRLLSGRLPTYPEGTDAQMAVLLQFTVLANGTVEAIIPLRKSNELLEKAAISALRTWRFDPLPAQLEQKSQTGRITFNFKLE